MCGIPIEVEYVFKIRVAPTANDCLKPKKTPRYALPI